MSRDFSPLTVDTSLSPNHSGTRTKPITRITPHCIVGQCTVERCKTLFPAGRNASSNYCISKDGKVVGIVSEKNRSWCTSSNENDQKAITIECSSDNTSPYAFTDACYNTLVDLCVDICKAYGKTKLIWIADKNTALSYSPKSDEMQLTVHMWYANKACPGPWLMARMDKLAATVTSRLGGTSTTTTTATTTTTTASGTLYRVRKSWADKKSQLGAYRSLENAKKMADKNSGYYVFDENGNTVYPTSSSTSTTTSTKSIDEIAKEVIAGKWGNGSDRKNRLTAAGYDYSTVQAKVNELCGQTSNKKSIDELAREVIAGKWGNGATRRQRLTAAGYDYSAVQKRVNQLL